MPTDIRFTVANTPGTTAKAARVLGDAGIAISGIGCDIRPGEGWGYIHFLVDDATEAVRALEGGGFEVLDIHEVDLVKTEERPGALADICQSYADRGENIEVLYAAFSNRVVVGTESQRRMVMGRTTAEASYADTRVSHEP